MASSYIPVSKSGGFRQVCRWLTAKASWWGNKYFAIPLLLSAMPTVVMGLLLRQQFRVSIEEQLGYAFDLSTLLWLAVAAIASPILLRALGAFIESKAIPERELTRDDLLLIMNTISSVVGNKLDRFSSEVQRQSTLTSHSAEDIFQRITNPQDQIRSLVNGVHVIFSSLDTTTQFRVGLLEVEEGKPTQWVSYFPSGRVPRTSPSDLGAPRSTVMSCVQKKKTVVIDNIQRELTKKETRGDIRQFIKGHSDNNEQGCQLCYPIIDKPTATVKYVLTIAGDRKDALRDRLRPIYDWIIEQLVVRIQIEACLLTLKGSAHAESSS